MGNRVPQLDAIRGIAILLVMFHNQSAKFPSLQLQGLFANGWMGVDLFFVLSGFLITGILLDTKRSDRYFKNFYARRCLRIWPLYFFVLFLMFVAIPVVRPSLGEVLFQRSSPWWAYPLFLQNLVLALPLNAAGPLSVTWSLAIEEQFYFVWPWVVRYCSGVRIARIAIFVICVSPVFRFFLSFRGIDLYPNTFCRLDGLMAGALLAVVVRRDDFVPSRLVGPAWTVLLIAIPLAFLTEAFQARWIVFSLSAAASTSLVYLALYWEHEWFQRIMKNRFIVYTGTISYGLYLLHKLPFDTAQEFIRFERHPLVTAAILLAACYGSATLSWTLLERPFLSLKRFFEPHPKVLCFTPEQNLLAMKSQ